MKNAPNFLLIDLFCGAGGTTTGAEMSGVCKVIAAVNHDPLAIKSHAANHADVLHLTEDILVADIRPVLKAVRHWQRIYPDAKMVLWASLECTNFSNAKGGMPRDADSRALANGLFRYLDALNPDYLLIENVKEFMSWGPLVPKVVKKKCGDFCPLHYDRKSGQMRSNLIPESRTRGKFYVHWVNKVKAYGYQHDYRLLNAANFGGVTIRERYFAAFWKPKVAFAWPQPTHAKRPQSSPMFNDNLKPWRPVAQVLDFEDMGKSIFDRKKPLVDRTLSRILAGLQKFYNRPSVMTCNTPGYCTDTDTPVGTITTTCHKALVTPILQSYYGNGQCTSINNPAPTCTTKDRMALVSPVTWICTNAFIVNPQYKNAGSSILDPAPTVIARQKSYPLALATPADSGTPK
ncbi:MAG: DNA cytosine methyltransferase [Lewinellaceae bacterium]|nr:DNA cytosine methyltransferase [Lewinellaceae bacterium]